MQNVAKHWTKVMSILSILTTKNEAGTNYLFHLLMFLNCWVTNDGQNHKALELLFNCNRKKNSFPKYSYSSGPSIFCNLS